MRLDYRKLSTLLKDAPSLAGVIELEKIESVATLLGVKRLFGDEKHAMRGSFPRAVAFAPRAACPRQSVG